MICTLTGNTLVVNRSTENQGGPSACIASRIPYKMECVHIIIQARVMEYDLNINSMYTGALDVKGGPSALLPYKMLCVHIIIRARVHDAHLWPRVV